MTGVAPEAGAAWPVGTPRFGVVGRSGAGKTTLVTQLVAALTARGLKVGTVKHASHAPSLDVKGKDSWRHAEAGATRVLLLGPDVAVGFVHADAPPELDGWGGFFDGAVDLVVVEGFKRTPMPHVWVEVDPAAAAATLTPRAAEPDASPAWLLARPPGEGGRFADALVEALADGVAAQVVRSP